MGKNEGDLHPNINFSTPDARHPEAFSAPHEAGTEDEIADFLAATARLVKPDFVLETGTSRGDTSVKIAQALQQNGFGHLLTVELKPNLAEIARGKLAGLPASVHTGPVELYTPPEGVRFQMAFFDADRFQTKRHRRDLEFMRFKPYLDTGAIVGFHDTGIRYDNLQPKPAQKAVDWLREKGHVRIVYFRCPRGFTLAEVL